jgi:hypothetical protein
MFALEQVDRVVVGRLILCKICGQDRETTVDALGSRSRRITSTSAVEF